LPFLRRGGAALTVGLALFVAPLGSGAADVRYDVLVGGRPLDRAGHSGLLHRGVTFVNIVRAVKAFSGLMVFLPSGVVRIAVGKHAFVFTVGSREALYDGTTPIHLHGAPFVLAGDTYVPASAIATLTGSTVTVDARRRAIDFEPGASSAEAEPSPAPAPAQALSFVPSATADAAGLHARVDIVNVTDKPYTLAFPGGTQLAFIVSGDGREVWNSATERTGGPAGTLTLGPHEAKSATADWPGFAQLPPGRYTLRVRLLTVPPLEGAPLRLGVATPAPSPTSS
jgi:hypothetical protein